MTASEQATGLGVPGALRWGNVLAMQAHRIPDVLAIADDHGARLDYRALHDEVRRAADYWLGVGVASGDRVAILGRNSVELVVNLLGLAWIGAIPVMLNWRLTTDELAELGRVCTPVAIAHDEEFSAGALAAAPAGFRVPLSGDSGSSTVSLRGRTSHGVDDNPADGAVLALLHTSGTTGHPKVIALDQQAHIWGCRRLTTVAGMNDGDVHLRFTPLFHLAGLQELGSSLLSGGTTHLQSEFDPDVWLDAVVADRVTFGHLPPATLRRVLAAYDRRETKPDIASLREIWYGTAPASGDLVTAALTTLGCDLRQVYGMTEAQSPVSMLDAVDHRGSSTRIGTAGKVLPEWEVRLRTPDGIDVVDGEPGELEIRGRQLFSGYWTPDGTLGHGIDADGWYRTGDMATLDQDGYLTIVDRVKDMIISGGENVFPAEVERVLSRHPEVHEISVIGVPDETWGESVHAVVVPRSPDTFDSAAFLDWCRDHIAGFKRPRSISIVDLLPRNASGKILKKTLRQNYSTTEGS